MYRKGKAYAHSTYIRPDRKEIMRFARQVAIAEGKSFSRFITDMIYDLMIGRLRYHQRSK